MLCYRTKEFCDIDGNRGIIIINAELTPEDDDEIIAELEMMYEPGKQYYTVTLYCEQFDSHHEFEVDINDYLTPEQIKGLT